MSKQTPKSDEYSTGTGLRRAAGVLVIAVVAVVALAVPGTAAPQQENPTVEGVTTTVEDGNLTLQVRADNVTEIGVTDVPADWEVVAHRDDFGVYGDRVAENGTVRWFWTAPFPVNVSVTFALPAERFETIPTLGVVPYAGTIRGDRVEVRPPLPTPTPTATPTPTETATQTPASSGSTDASTDQTTARPVAGDGNGSATTAASTAANGPGFGVPAVALAGLLLAVTLWVARRTLFERS